jgi:hypothetical protein
MILLQEMIMLGAILMVVLCGALLIGVPILVYFFIKRDKDFPSYTTIEKVVYTLLTTLFTVIGIIAIIMFLFSLIDLSNS